MLARLRKAQQENEGGFTLIELLVVVIIIGILAAIAIPTFLNQREKAWEKAAKSDLRNNAVVAETLFSDTGSYATLAAGMLKNTDGVVLSAFGDADSYCITANHDNLATDYKLLSTAGKPAVGACTDANG